MGSGDPGEDGIIMNRVTTEERSHKIQKRFHAKMQSRKGKKVLFLVYSKIPMFLTFFARFAEVLSGRLSFVGHCARCYFVDLSSFEKYKNAKMKNGSEQMRELSK